MTTTTTTIIMISSRSETTIGVRYTEKWNFVAGFDFKDESQRYLLVS